MIEKKQEYTKSVVLYLKILKLVFSQLLKQGINMEYQEEIVNLDIFLSESILHYNIELC